MSDPKKFDFTKLTLTELPEDRKKFWEKRFRKMERRKPIDTTLMLNHDTGDYVRIRKYKSGPTMIDGQFGGTITTTWPID